jgi:membrane-bound serine protease (ClpP class)
MLGIIIELRTPGLGIAGALGVMSLALFLWGHWLVQLVGWEELLLVLGGVLLLALEILVVPGFGVAGVLGILALVAALVLSVLGPGATPEFLIIAAGRIVLAMLLALIASLVLLRFLPRIPFGRRLVLQTELDARRGYASAPRGDVDLLGKQGRATSPLRPAGIAEIGGRRVDVVSEGELIESGELIEVIRVDGNRIVVRRTTTTNDKET